jgi:chemotaxis protein MotA
MDLTVLGGMVLAISVIAIGDTLEGGNPIHLLHITSIMIVVPSALLASMAATHGHFVKGAYKNLGFVFKKSTVNYEKTIEQLYDFAIIARRDGLLKLEAEINNVEDEFFRKGLDLVVSGVNVDVIRQTLEIEIEETEHFYHGSGHYWVLAGETCPVMGLIGAVLGLIMALAKLDNPQEMASGIAGAFTATVTGIVSSYILFGPIGRKMIAKSHDIIKQQTIILEGLVSLVSGDNPKMMKGKLYNYIGGEKEEGAKH